MLWRLRALQIIMRANAPITAALALAALSLFPAPAHAKPTRYARQQPTAQPASRHHTTTQLTESHYVHHGDHVSTPKHLRAQGHESATILPVRSRPRAHRHSELARRSTHISRVATPVPVVSVIRPIAERPQLPSVEDAATTPTILPELYNRRGRLIMPAPLKGSHEILIRQNLVADRDGLYRIQNDDDLDNMREHGLLVTLPISTALEVDERLPFNRRYARPWTAEFLANISRAHYARFHTPLQVNSAVRTVEFQQHLLHINGNAAPAEGDTASPHLTGQAVDLAKRGLSLTEIAWMRGYLLPLVQQGKVDVEEEFQQSCFHISVYKRYLPSSTPPREIVANSHSGTQALATAIH